MSRAARLSFAVLLGALALTGAVSADESAMVHIRARSQLRLREVERVRERGLFRLGISVQLDDNQPGHPAADGAGDDAARSFTGQRVLLKIMNSDGGDEEEIERKLLFTDASGEAGYRAPGLKSGRYRFVAHYEGDAERDSSDADLTVDLDRRPTELTLEAPPTLGLRESLPLTLSLRSPEDREAAGEPPRREVTLRLTLGGRELQRERLFVGAAPTSESVPLPRGEPPPPGAVLTVEARFAGDVEMAPAEARRDVVLTSQARVTLELVRARAAPAAADGTPELPQAGPVALAGTAFDERGPLAAEVVDIEAAAGPEGGRRHLGSVFTDGYGRYSLSIPRLNLPVGPALLVAQVTPRHSQILPGRSAELPIQVLPPEPVSLLYFLLPLGLTLLGLGTALTGRLVRPRLVAWLDRLRAGRRAPVVAAPPSSPQLPATGEAGVTLGSRAGLTLRRTVDTVVDGVVADAVFGPVVAGALLVATAEGPRAGEPSVETRTGPDGRFGLVDLKPGRYRVRVSAAGFAGQEFTATVPHRGELRGVMVRLLPLRARLHGEWQRVALAIAGEEAQLHTRTPAELLQKAEGRLAPPTGVRPLSPSDLGKLRRLTALVEQGYYSQRRCTEAMLSEAERLAAAILEPAAGSEPPAAPAPPRPEIRAPGAPRPLV